MHRLVGMANLSSRFKASYLFICILSFVSWTAQAVDILVTAEQNFFHADDQSRVGIEVEFTGISLDDSAKILRQKLGGSLSKGTQTITTTLKGYDSAGKAIYNSAEIPLYNLKGSSIGDMVLKMELNQVSDSEMSSSKDAILELVTDPFSGVDKVATLEGATQALKNAGAIGTTAKTAVSTQINVEIGAGVRENIKSQDVVNLMRSYFRPEHRLQIENRELVPEVRKPYVEAYSPGFMKRMLDPNYNPTWRQLYDDYMYRQSLEVLGEKDAWTASIAQVKKRLLSMKNPIAPKVVKQNALRITSLLGYMIPEDPMTKIMEESGWVKPYPLIEFREWNNDFNMLRPYKRSLGLLTAAEKYGYYDHDRLMYQLTGVEVDTIKQLREKSLKSERTGKVFTWRYFLANPEEADKEEYYEHWKAMYEKKDMVGFLPTDERGLEPLHVPGESVIMHRRGIHRSSILGKYNPGLINAQIAQTLENKYAEARFWMEYAPDMMPKTTLLTDTIGTTTSATKALQALNQAYPNGWIIKGVWDLGTEGMLITNSTDVAGELKTFKTSGFLEYKAKLDADPKLKAAGYDYYIKELSEHPGYKGWKITELLKKRNLYLVQARMDIAKEFRVEVIGGKVLGNGSTIDRYAYRTGYDPKKSNITPKDIEDVENYVRKALARLPEELRGTPFAFDIAKNRDGSLGIVESNPGSNSNFLYEEDWKPSVKALSKYLDDYPEAVKRGEVPLGMSPEEQMSFIQKKFGEWNISIKDLYKGFTFSPNEVTDVEIPPRQPNGEQFEVGTKKDACAKNYETLMGILRKGGR